ncbi:hypothetical protein ACN47E_008826 [Coniothyrium glycines]
MATVRSHAQNTTGMNKANNTASNLGDYLSELISYAQQVNSEDCDRVSLEDFLLQSRFRLSRRRNVQEHNMKLCLDNALNDSIHMLSDPTTPGPHEQMVAIHADLEDAYLQQVLTDAKEVAYEAGHNDGKEDNCVEEEAQGAMMGRIRDCTDGFLEQAGNAKEAYHCDIAGAAAIAGDAWRQERTTKNASSEALPISPAMQSSEPPSVAPEETFPQQSSLTAKQSNLPSPECDTASFHTPQTNEKSKDTIHNDFSKPTCSSTKTLQTRIATSPPRSWENDPFKGLLGLVGKGQ